MEQRVLEFVHGLRRCGVPVTLAETLDALRGLTLIPLWDRGAFQDALRTTLVKSSSHHREFDRLFTYYFSHLFEEIAWAGPQVQSGQDRILNSPEVEQALDEAGVRGSPLGRAIMTGDGMAMEQMAKEAAEIAGVSQIQYSLQLGFFTRRLMDQFDWAGLDQELRQTLSLMKSSTAPETSIISYLFEHNREAFRRLLRRLVERELEKNIRPPRERQLVGSLEGKSFSSLSDQEVQQMQEVVARLVQRLRTKVGLLERKRRKGRLDVRRTLRRNMQYGGEPMELLFRERRKKKTEVMALCDVSSSVWTASRFMLNLLYAIQDQFAKVRSFVFVSDLGEVTEFFSRYEINEAIRKALKEAGIRYHTYTDYGDVFLRFRDEYLGEVNSRTVVIIIGDGRNNRLPSRAWVLEEIRERARQLIWLNPEPRATWGLGDSVMHEYAPHCTLAEECRNLKQLAAFIDRLVV
ncbi:MAG: vWA domain-containing protein [Thermodesulfobacteriota bacterium]